MADKPAGDVVHHGNDDDDGEINQVKTWKSRDQQAERIKPVEYDVSIGTFFFPIYMHFDCLQQHYIQRYSVAPFIQAVKVLEKGHIANQTGKQTREDNYLRKQQAHSMP